MQVSKLINCRQVEVYKSIRVRTMARLYIVLYYTMTDMELDSTEEQKKSWYAALREKHSQEMADLQAKLDAEIAGRAADKKLYFGNTMKSKGYEWDFDSFADKYSSLDINDLVSLYEGQNGKPIVQQAEPTVPESNWPKSVIAWANPTTEVGGKKLGEMNTEELLNFAKTQSRYKN